MSIHLAELWFFGDELKDIIGGEIRLSAPQTIEDLLQQPKVVFGIEGPPVMRKIDLASMLMDFEFLGVAVDVWRYMLPFGGSSCVLVRTFKRLEREHLY